MSLSSPVTVAILGATGTVGRRLVERVVAHPWFQLIEVAASERSAGRVLSDSWENPDDLPAEIGALRLGSLDGDFAADLILSALPKAPAAAVEARLAAAGKLVVSNASAGRMMPGVPLIIPEINPSHLDLLGPAGVPTSGVITNPNCAVIPLAMALAPLHEEFGIESVVATTFQAVSGAGLPGPGSITLIDNILPRIQGEEEKIQSEPQKILGQIEGGNVVPALFAVSATSTRVPVIHGHLVDVSVRLIESTPLARAVDALNCWPGHVADLALPSLPKRPLRVLTNPDRPQPRLDRDVENGMAVTVGRIRECPVNGLRFAVLAHNLERGAAGAAIANAELAVRTGRVGGVRFDL